MVVIPGIGPYEFQPAPWVQEEAGLNERGLAV